MNDAITIDDIGAIDVIEVRGLNQIKNIDTTGVTAEMFTDVIDLEFEVRRADGVSVVLPGCVRALLVFQVSTRQIF